MHVIAHRGASGTKIENTRAAFREAVKLGATAIEMDIQRCASGELVVFHDRDLLRLADRAETIRQLTLKDLRSISLRNPLLPDHQEKIPTLEEVVTDEFIPDDIVLCLEIKSEGIESDLVRFVTENHLTDRSVIYSFRIEHLDRIRSIDSTVRTNLLFGRDRERNLELAVDHGITMINPEYYDADPDFIDKALAHGVSVTVGRTNDRDMLNRLVSLPVWGIHTDYPDRLVEAIRLRHLSRPSA